jgi:hypothetical protein
MMGKASRLMSATLWLIVTAALIYLIVSLYWILTSSKYTLPFNEVKLSAAKQCADIIGMATGIEKAEIKNEFPYGRYITSTDLEDLTCIVGQLKTLDALLVDHEGLSPEVMLTALTDSMQSRLSLGFNTYTPDTVLSVLNWAEKVSDRAMSDPRYGDLLSAVSDYWFNHIAVRLSLLQNGQKDIKVDFRYRYLAQRLSERGYLVNTSDSKLEKFKKSLVSGKWQHLVSATWNDSNFIMRISYILIAILLFMGLDSLYIFIKKKLTRKPV